MLHSKAKNILFQPPYIKRTVLNKIFGKNKSQYTKVHFKSSTPDVPTTKRRITPQYKQKVYEPCHTL